MMSVARWVAAASPLRRRRMSSPVRIGASGFLSSCASVARNSSLRLSALSKASSARSRTCISCSSVRLACCKASERRPISASMSLKASASTPISPLSRPGTRSEKSRRCITWRDTSVIAFSGRVIQLCMRRAASDAITSAASITATRMPP